MQVRRICFGLILTYGLLIPVVAFSTEEPSGPLDDHPEWLTCASSSECTSVKLGCYYWQPINRKYAASAPASACSKSNLPGPQPTVSCVDHRCENDPFTVREWLQLESYQKYQLVSARVEVCRQAAGLTPRSGDDASWTTRYMAVLDKSIREHQFPDNEVLTTTMKKIVPCEELVAWEQDQEKWQAIQSKDKSARRVVVEQVHPKYPLDDLYPPLISYAKVFQQCGQNSSRRDVTFSGEMNAEFTINPNGTIDPRSVKAGYPGVAYMRPFLDCASTAFKKLAFPKSKDGQPIYVKTLIQIISASMVSGL